MICQNCGKNEANVKYTQIINGVKKQMSLCSDCAKQLGVDDIGFNMPISFSSFLGDMFEDYEESFMPNLISTNKLICDNCHMTYDEFLSAGKFGCEHCYETFENKINPLLKSIQGSNEHIGRVENLEERESKKTNTKSNKKINKIKYNEHEKETSKDKQSKIKEDEIKKLKERLKIEVKEERYEDAAKTRDEIKKLER